MENRGVSEVIGYVLLVAIAMGIAVLVFGFLKSYVPKEKPECNKEINIIADNIKCFNNRTDNILNLTLENRGLFKIDFAYLRVGNKAKQFREDIPKNNPVRLTSSINTGGLDPGESTFILSYKLPAGYSSNGEYVLEIQPAYYTEGKDIESIAICFPISQTISCS